MLFFRRPLPVHSAHVGQELEIHYQWHPYFGQKVTVRRVEQRATGQYLRVQGHSGAVIDIAGWMTDPVACATMTFGEPRVDLRALIELRRVLIGGLKGTHFPSDVRVVREEADVAPQVAGDGKPANEVAVVERQVINPSINRLTQSTSILVENTRKNHGQMKFVLVRESNPRQGRQSHDLREGP